MDLIGIGTGELIVIMVVVLVVFGPHKIPEVAKYLAKATKMFRDASRELQHQIEMVEWEMDKAIEKESKKSKESTAVVSATETSLPTTESASTESTDSTVHSYYNPPPTVAADSVAANSSPSAETQPESPAAAVPEFGAVEHTPAETPAPIETTVSPSQETALNGNPHPEATPTPATAVPKINLYSDAERYRRELMD